MNNTKKISVAMVLIMTSCGLPQDSIMQEYYKILAEWEFPNKEEIRKYARENEELLIKRHNFACKKATEGYDEQSISMAWTSELMGGTDTPKEIRSLRTNSQSVEIQVLHNLCDAWN